MAKTNKTISEVLKEANKKYGIEIGFDDGPVDVISSGNLGIDFGAGLPGGFPVGRSVELYGLPSSGKTTTALQTAAEAQKRIKAGNTGQVILYLDYEHALDKEYCKSLGLDIEDEETFILVQPVSFEQGANFAKAMISTGQVLLAIWDSVAAMMPETVIEEEVGKPLVAPLARVFGPFMGTLNALIHEHQTSAIFINHLSEKIGGMPSFTGPQKTTPGGKALKFYSSVRLEFTKIKSIKEDRADLFGGSSKFTVASDVKVKVEKNKVGPPGKEIVLKVRFGKGFDNFDTAVRILQGMNLIYGATGYNYFDRLPDLVRPSMPVSSKNLPYLRGNALSEYADEYPEWADKVIETARQKLVEGVEPVLSLADDDGGMPSLMLNGLEDD